MAKISNLKAKRDENNRIIKCLIVEDYRDKNVYKHYDINKFDEIIERTDSMFLTKVFAPTSEEREQLFKLIQDNVKDGKVEISDRDILSVMFTKFTDLELDVDDEELLYILANPSEFLMQIKSEMDKILISCIEAYVELQKTLASAPTVTEVLTKDIKEKQNLIDEDKAKKDKERKELEKRLAELG